MFSEQREQGAKPGSAGWEKTAVVSGKLAFESWGYPPTNSKQFVAAYYGEEQKKSEADGKPSGHSDGQEKEISDLIKKLGAAKFADREAAGKALKKKGMAAIEQLEKAKESDDQDVSDRAKKLIAQIQECRPKDLLWKITEGVKEERRKEIEGLLAKEKLEEKDKECLRSHKRVGAAFVMYELVDLVQREGKDALAGRRGKELVELLQSSGKEAAAACFAVLDHSHSDPAVEQVAKTLLGDIAKKELVDQAPEHWLYDYRDRVRRVGKEFEVDYSDGELVRVKDGRREMNLIKPGFVRAKSKYGDVVTELDYRDVKRWDVSSLVNNESASILTFIEDGMFGNHVERWVDYIPKKDR